MSHSPSRLGLWTPASVDLTLDGTGAVCRTRHTFFTWRNRVGDLQGNFLLNIFAGCEPVRTLHMWEDREEHQEQARSWQDRWTPWSTPLDTPLDSEPRNAGNKKTEECVPVLTIHWRRCRWRQRCPRWYCLADKRERCPQGIEPGDDSEGLNQKKGRIGWNICEQGVMKVIPMKKKSACAKGKIRKMRRCICVPISVPGRLRLKGYFCPLLSLHAGIWLVKFKSGQTAPQWTTQRLSMRKRIQTKSNLQEQLNDDDAAADVDIKSQATCSAIGRPWLLYTYWPLLFQHRSEKTTKIPKHCADDDDHDYNDYNDNCYFHTDPPLT